jgi:hypothetical protein
MRAVRVESDSMGEIGVPADKLWGDQTQCGSWSSLLCGALELTTYDGSFSLRAGDVLFTRKRLPATIGSRSASNHGGACMPSLTKQPFRPTGPHSVAAGPESRKAKAAAKTGAGP